MATPIEVRNSKLGPKVVKALQNRRFDAWYVEDPEAAVEKAFSLIPKGDLIGWGGSFTVEALGLTKLAREKGYPVLDRDAAATPEDRLETMRQVLTCDTFLCSSNAISEDGQLVNVDGFGNRVAAMIFGPKQVILVAGMNKVVKTLEDAYTRARTIAAPRNTQRFPGKKTPCNETGSCANCNSPDSICTFIVATRLCNPPGRIKVILIGKDLGL
ncbi:lactate utilization protein [Treponema primitia]|uniref:lactate utilization protein n=1 Tax=Treponema primitia TaxID=88058 RepID=UPI000255519A|nr:lactate utilization protein [Treponema primitia]